MLSENSEMRGAGCDEKRALPGNDLSYQAIKVRVSGAVDLQIPHADFVDGLIVDDERDLAMLKGRMGVQYRIVRLHYGGRYL